MSKKPKVTKVPDEPVVELRRSDEDSEPVVVCSGETEVSREPELIQSDVFGVTKSSKREQVKDLRSKGPDESLLKQERAGREDLEDRWEEGGGRVWNKGLIVAAGVVLLLVAAGVVWAVSRLDGGLVKGRGTDEALEKVEIERESKDASALRLVQEMETLCREFVAADSVEDLLPLVRDRERVEPLIRDYYAEKPVESGKFEKVSARIPVEVNRRIFWLLSYRTMDSSEPKQILVEQSEQGVVMDWESHVAYQPKDPSEFVSKRWETPVPFRVYVENSGERAFYGYEFSDYKEYRGYKIMFRDRERYLWGYVKVGSELDKKMQSLFKSGRNLSPGNRNQAPAMLELRYPEDSMSERCVHIEALLSDSWVQFD